MEKPIKQSRDQRLAAGLGLEPPVDIQDEGSFMKAWTAHGAIIAWGTAADKLRLASSEASEVTESSPSSDILALTAPPLIPPVELRPVDTRASIPNEGETPLAWLTRVADPTATRDWVMAQGLGGPHAQAWAGFAAAMGWEIAVPPPAEEPDPTPDTTKPEA